MASEPVWTSLVEGGAVDHSRLVDHARLSAAIEHMKEWVRWLAGPKDAPPVADPVPAAEQPAASVTTDPSNG